MQRVHQIKASANTSTSIPTTVAAFSFGNGEPRAVDQATLDITQRYKMQIACRASNMVVRLSGHTGASVLDIKSRVNGANGGQSISIGGTATGVFKDISGSDSLAVNDSFNFSILRTGGSSASLDTLGCYIKRNTAPGASDVHVMNSTGASVALTASATRYCCLNGRNAWNSAENTEQFRIATNGTLAFLHVYIDVAPTNTATIRSRVNTANGNQSISVGGGVTGFLVDVSNSDSLSAFSLINASGTAGAVTPPQTTQVGCVFYNTHGFYTIACAQAGLTVNQAVTTFIRFGGQLGFNTTEANQRLALDTSFFASNLQISINTNTVTAASTFTSRKDLAAGGQAISIPASTTGIFHNSSGSDHVRIGESLYARLATGSGGTSMSVLFVATQIGPWGEDYRRVAQMFAST